MIGKYMPYKNPENARKHRQDYYLINAEKLKQYQLEYRRRYRDKISEKRRKYRHENKEKIKLQKKESRIRNLSKNRVLSYYSGGNPICSCCGETELIFLTLDHVDERKKSGHSRELSGEKLYRWAEKNNFPQIFKVLCFNCNYIKYLDGICLHKQDNHK